MQDVEFAVVALAGDPAEPLELVPAQRVKPLVTRSVLQKYNCTSFAARIQCRVDKRQMERCSHLHRVHYNSLEINLLLKSIKKFG